MGRKFAGWLAQTCEVQIIIIRRRFSPSESLGTLRPRCPKEHLVPILVQNPQAIGVLRHIQSVEERLGLDLCAPQIRRDVRNAIEHGARIVLFANAEELYRKHHFCVSLATKCKAPNKLTELAATKTIITHGWSACAQETCKEQDRCPTCTPRFHHAGKKAKSG